MSDLADDSVGLLTWAGDPDRVIQDVEWKLEDRQDSTNRLFVTTTLAEADGVEADQELIYDGRRFAVAEIDRVRSADTALIEADEVQAELSSLIIEELKMQSWTVETAVNRALRDTRWTAGELQDVRPGRSEFEEISVLDALKFIARHQDARVVFDSMRRRVNLYQNAGVVHEHVFTYGRELTNIEKAVVAPRTTRIYPTGADDMGIASVNDGVEYVENFDYYLARGLTYAQAVSRFLKEEYWSDNRYEIPENLKRDAEKRLEEESWPQITYTLTAAATLAVDGVDDFDLRTIHLGDQVYVWDQEVGAKLRAEVTAVTTSSDASENELILSALPDSLGSSIEGRYFGDSGRATDGPNRWTSPVPPRPSMPILESVNDLGVGKVRWNGQDENGDHHTIPERFGTLETIVAPYGEDGSIPSPDGDTAFSGTTITSRNGGISTVSFAAPGNFAVWFYLVGYDARTRGPYSEPLSVEVEALVDTEAIRQQLDEAQERIDQAQRDLDESVGRVEDLAEQWGDVDFPQLKADLEQAQQAVADAQQRLDTAEQEVADSAQKITDAEARLDATEQAVTDSQSNIDQLRDVTLPQLEESLTNAVTAAEDAIQAFQQEWDENWDPEAMDELRDRQETLEGDLITGLDSVYTQAQQLATAAENNAVGRAASDAQSEYDRLQELAERALSRAGDNVLEDPSFETDYWFDQFNNHGAQRYGFEPGVTWPRTGDQAMRIERIETDNNTISVSYFFGAIDVEPDESYRMSIWYRTENDPNLSQGVGTRLRINEPGETVATLAESEILEPGEEYRRAVVTYTIPEGITQISPVLRVSHNTGTLIVDDVSFQEVGAAAEALRLAEVARQESEAAHVAAGNARDMAVTAQDTAAGKADVIRSTTAPTGTAPEGSIWFRYNNMTASRRLIGWWVRESGAWRSQEMDETILPQVNIGTGTYGDLDGDRLTANTVKAGALSVVPDGRDLAPDLVDYADLWTLGSQVSIEPSIASESGLAFRVTGDASAAAGRARGPWIPVRAGDTIYYKLNLGWYTRIPDGELRIYVMYNGSLTSWTRLHSATSTGTYEGHFTIPRDGTTKVAFAVTVDTPATNGGDWSVRDFDVRVSAKGVHIQPQGIKAPQIDVQSLSADSAFLNALEVDLLKGRLAVLDEAIIGNALLRDNAITAGKLAILPDAADFAPGPGGYEDLWTVGSNNAIVSASNDPSGAQLRVSPGGAAGNSTRTRGPWIRAQGGDAIYYRMFVGRTNSPDAALRIYFMYDGSITSWEQVWLENAGGWVEGVHTVRDDVESTVALAFITSGGTQGNYWIRHMDVRKQVKGVLIEDGAITANHIVAESVAGAVAQFITLEAENVIATLLQASNAEFQDVVARVATLIELNASRITAGTISASRLDISDLAARIATVVSLNASRITTGTLNADRININSLFTNSAFISNLAAEAVEAIRVTTQQIITGDIIATGTIDVEHLNVTQRMTGAIANFLTVEAGHIAANAIDGMTMSGGLIDGGTVRGALIETTSQANRGIKLDSSALRAWDPNGNPRFQLNVSTGNFTATGTVRTDFTGPRVELFDDAAGGQIRFFNSNRRASIKMDAVGQRLSLTYGNPSDDVPFLGVERNRAMLQYRSQRFEVGGTTASNQYTEFDGGGISARFLSGIQFRNGSRVQFLNGSNNSAGYMGQRPGTSGPHLEIAVSSDALRVSGGQIRCLSVYDDSTTLSANMRVSPGDGLFRRSSSASRYKVDPRPLEAPASLLDIPLKEWIDKGELERWGDIEAKPRPFTEDEQETYDSINLKRVPGVVAEEVEAHGGRQFVEYGPDGELEEVDYDRLAIAQIQILKRKNEALEERLEALEKLVEVAA